MALINYALRSESISVMLFFNQQHVRRLRVKNVSFFCFCVISLPQSQVAEKGRELKELKDTLALVVKEKEKLEGVGDSFHFLFYRLLPL